MATEYLIVPGLGNSGPEHWQTLLESALPNARRIIQDEWDAPRCQDWIERIESEVQQTDAANVVLIAHSLGCTAVAHWAAAFGTVVKGAFLVAPSDCEAPGYNFPTEGFAPIPLASLPFPSVVVASSDDIYVSAERAAFFARTWGSDFEMIGAAGHINVASGHGSWPQGIELLKKLG